jgi:hypothetical protein
LTSALALANLEAKLTKPDFRNDLATLTRRPPSNYTIEGAAQMVATEVLALLDN